MVKFELNPHWKSDLAEHITTLVVMVIIFSGIYFAPRVLLDVARSIAACPIHITTDRSDYCMSIGIGR